MRRRHTIRGLLALAAMVGSTVGASISSVAPVLASSARTHAIGAGPTSLGVANFGRILVDAATSHVFVSSPGSNAVVVLDLNGSIIKTINGESSAGAMSIAAGTLYVALNTTGTIEKIDTTTLVDAGPLVTGLSLIAGGAGGVPPSDMVFAHSKLWVTTYSSSAGGGTGGMQLVAVDPSKNPAAVTTYPAAFTLSNGLLSNAVFASNPAANPDVLLAFELGSPEALTTFDLSTGSPVQLQHATISGIGQDMAISADGVHVIAPVAGPYEFEELNLSDLQSDGVHYPAQPYPISVAATAAKGGLIAGVSTSPGTTMTAWAYQAGQPSVPLTRQDLSANLGFTPNRGLAVSPDGTNAFVVSPGSVGPLLNIVPIAPPGIPAPPTAVTATAGVDLATVTWAAPVNQGTGPVTSYTVTSSPAGPTVTAGPTATSAVLSPLTAHTSYRLIVTATNSVGTSVQAFSNSIVVLPRLPGPPTNANAVPGDGEAFVSWSAPADPGDDPITAYRVTPYVGATPQSPTPVNGSPLATSALVTGLTNGTTYTFTIAAISGAGYGPESAPSSGVTPIQGGNYHPLTPARILDTRNAIGGPTQPLHNTENRAAQITGQGKVPDTGVSAVVLNVTVTGGDSAGYLTVYPAGVSRPTASNLNFVAGQTVPNLVEVAVGRGGQVNVFTQFANATGHADVIFDVAGWVGVADNSLVKAGLYNPLTPARIMDTRLGLGVRKGSVGQGQTVTLNVFGPGGVPAGSGVSAVVLNVTVTSPTDSSYLTVFPADAAQPTASNLNFIARQTVPNRVMVKVGAGGLVSFYNAAGNVDVIADIGGWFTDATSMVGGARFSGIVPTRMLDTRDPTIGPLIGGQINTFQLLDQNMQPVTGVSALVFNVTAANPTTASYVTLWPDGPARPPVSDLNFVAGKTVPNLVVVKLGASATIDVYNALGQTDLIMDLVGVYGADVPAPAAAVGPFSFRLEPRHQQVAGAGPAVR